MGFEYAEKKLVVHGKELNTKTSENMKSERYW